MGVARGGPPILTFHALDEATAPDSFPPDRFARGMAALHAHGYRAIDLQDLVNAMGNGEPFPERAFVLTFDDGCDSVYVQAAPILARYGWTATIFLVTGEGGRQAGPDRPPEVSGRRMMSWREIDDLRAAGYSFGAHSLSHPDLTRIPPARAEWEITASKERLAEALGIEIRAFAYPFGRHDASTRAIVRRYFDCACTDRLGLPRRGGDLHALERVDAHYLRRDRLLSAILAPWFPLYLRARAVPRRLRRAVRARGAPS